MDDGEERGRHGKRWGKRKVKEMHTLEYGSPPKRRTAHMSSFNLLPKMGRTLLHLQRYLRCDLRHFRSFPKCLVHLCQITIALHMSSCLSHHPYWGSLHLLYSQIVWWLHGHSSASGRILFPKYICMYILRTN